MHGLSSLTALMALVALAACAGPRVVANSGPGKSMAAFQLDDVVCKRLSMRMVDTLQAYARCMTARGNFVHFEASGFTETPHVVSATNTGSSMTSPSGSNVALRDAAQAADRAHNYAEAARLYQQIETEGGGSAVYARFMLGQYYSFGLGVPQSYSDAAMWYSKAIETGEPPRLAYLQLGVLYYYGVGVPQDREKAFSLWHESGVPSGNLLARLATENKLPHNFAEYRHFDIQAAARPPSPAAAAPPPAKSASNGKDDPSGGLLKLLRDIAALSASNRGAGAAPTEQTIPGSSHHENCGYTDWMMAPAAGAFGGAYLARGC